MQAAKHRIVVDVTSDTEHGCGFAKLSGRRPTELIEDACLCDEAISVLEDVDGGKHLLLDWLRGYELQLATGGQCSCRLIQKALEVSGGPARDALVARLVP